MACGLLCLFEKTGECICHFPTLTSANLLLPWDRDIKPKERPLWMYTDLSKPSGGRENRFVGVSFGTVRYVLPLY